MGKQAPGTHLRIAILGSRGYPSTYGGFETFVRRLAPYLADQGHEVSVYCRGPGLRWSKQQAGPVIQIYTPGVDRKSTSTLSYGLTGALDALGRRFDAVLVLNPANGFWIPAIKLGGARVAINVDGIEWERAKWNRVGKSVFRLGASASSRFADVLVVDSRSVGTVWRSMFDKETQFIPYGADVVSGRATDRIEKLGLQPRSYFLVVARLVPENNLPLILDAYRLLDPKQPLVVVGSSNYRSEVDVRLEQACRDLPVRHLGHIDDQDLLTDLWAHAGVYIHGHSVGGTNPALLQALAAGSPTLALDTTHSQEVVDSPEQLFPPDPEQLAKKMDALMADPGLQDQFANEGRRRIEAEYTWDRVLKQYEDMITGMVRS